jgi:hypothetical protein
VAGVVVLALLWEHCFQLSTGTSATTVGKDLAVDTGSQTAVAVHSVRLAELSAEADREYRDQTEDGTEERETHYPGVEQRW